MKRRQVIPLFTGSHQLNNLFILKYALPVFIIIFLFHSRPRYHRNVLPDIPLDADSGPLAAVRLPSQLYTALRMILSRLNPVQGHGFSNFYFERGSGWPTATSSCRISTGICMVKGLFITGLLHLALSLEPTARVFQHYREPGNSFGSATVSLRSVSAQRFSPRSRSGALCARRRRMCLCKARTALNSFAIYTIYWSVPLLMWTGLRSLWLSSWNLRPSSLIPGNNYASHTYDH